MRKANKWVSFITKLNRQTQEDRIQWRLEGDQPDLLNSDFQQYGPAYVVHLDDATIRMYKEKIRQETAIEEEFWGDLVVLEIRTPEAGDFIRVPRTPGLEDLYESVAYKTGRVDEFVDKFLSS
jgi:hypothetical protein